MKKQRQPFMYYVGICAFSLVFVLGGILTGANFFPRTGNADEVTRNAKGSCGIRGAFGDRALHNHVGRGDPDAPKNGKFCVITARCVLTLKPVLPL